MSRTDAKRLWLKTGLTLTFRVVPEREHCTSLNVDHQPTPVEQAHIEQWVYEHRFEPAPVEPFYVTLSL